VPATPLITGSTRLMAIVGDPVKQVRSPTVLNEIFATRKAGIVCFPLHVPASDLKTAWGGLRAMANVVGFGITVPHKQAALSLCDSLDPMAERLGAVNLVRRERDGSLRGYQFDGIGFIGGLRSRDIAVAGRHCQLIGAGGAATAIAFALASASASVIAILNRDIGRAEQLAAAVNSAFGKAIAYSGQLQLASGSLVINATSLGMQESDPLPLPTTGLRPGIIVADVIAQPRFTRLLTVARERGATVHRGIHMVEAQAPAIADCICELWNSGPLDDVHRLMAAEPIR
jgi:shikimate dehydrogenase